MPWPARPACQAFRGGDPTSLPAVRATPREHNGIIVSAKARRFEEGLILDPWRKGGRLWWGRFPQDKSHPWKPLPWELTPMALRPYLMPELYPAEAAKLRQSHPF